MKSSLLLWDELLTIVPESNYRASYEDHVELARAWELIGRGLAPDEIQKSRAHDAIATTLAAGVLPPNMYIVGEVDQPRDLYEVWLQKFSPSYLGDPHAA